MLSNPHKEEITLIKSEIDFSLDNIDKMIEKLIGKNMGASHCN